MKILYALLGAMALYWLQNILYKHYWVKNLRIELKFTQDNAVEGDQLSLVETVVNKKFLPLPILQLKFMTTRHFAFLDTENTKVSDNFYRNDILSVMMYQKLTRTLPFICSHRGFFTVDHMDALCMNIFLSSKFVNGYDVNQQLYVYPGPVEYDQFQVPFQKMLGTVLAKRYINEDPFEFRGIREYQSYDNLKAVNWKASAKTGSLKVNVNDYTASQQVKILLNLESETIWNYEDLKEESIRLAAAFAAAFIAQGISCALYTNARDVVTGNILNVPAGSGQNHIRTINEVLARIDLLLKIPAFVPTVQEEIMNASDNDYVVIISSYQKEDLLGLLSEQSRGRRDYSWIVPVNREVQVTVPEEYLPHITAWELKA